MNPSNAPLLITSTTSPSRTPDATAVLVEERVSPTERYMNEMLALDGKR